MVFINFLHQFPELFWFFHCWFFLFVCFLFLINLKGVAHPQKMTRPCNQIGAGHPGYVVGVRETGKVRMRDQSLPARSDSTFQLVISIVREVGTPRN